MLGWRRGESKDGVKETSIWINFGKVRKANKIVNKN
jgi:hypothetical protein